MKNTITKIALALGIITATGTQAQTLTFEEFTLADSSYYENTSGNDWTSGPATFRYDWGGYWSGGSAYNNMTDTVHYDYHDLYVCIPHKGFGASNNYVTMQNNSVVTFSNNTTMVNGFYVTNTSYAWKSIKSGDSFARKFGDTTGTHCNGMYAQGGYPDWFKVSVLGYSGGVLRTDTVHYYLADYRPAGTINDYVTKNWQYVDCSALGQVDSVQFVLSSSDNNPIYGMNTPAFFSIDNLALVSTVGVKEITSFSNISLYPNPTSSNVYVIFDSKSVNTISLNIFDVTGKITSSKVEHISAGQNQILIETSALEAGVYFIELNDGLSSKKIKFIKL